MATPRLPNPGGDNGSWGDILNEFLSVEHNANGTLKKAGDILGAQQKDEKGQPDGYAPLDGNGKVPTLNLPSFATLDGAQVYEVYLHIDYVPDPPNLNVNDYNLQEGFHVLITWTDGGEGGNRGIYVVQGGQLVFSTDIFDGNHNGALIWAYRQTDGVVETGPLLYGVYTTEFCSLVTLANNTSIPNTYVSKLGDTMSGHLGVATSNDYGALTVGGTIVTDDQGDIFRQHDQSAGGEYPILARYWNNHDTFPAGTFIFGSGTNPWVGIEQPGGNNVNLFRVHANNTSISNDLSVGGIITGTGKLQVPVMNVSLNSFGTVGTITKDVPFYYQQSDDNWYAKETLTTIPFSVSPGHVASLGFEPVIMPFSSFYFNILTCTITVTSADGAEVLSVDASTPFEVADGFEFGYDPVVWNPSPTTQTGSQLSISNTHVDTSTQNVFQATVSFTANIVFDDGTGHSGN